MMNTNKKGQLLLSSQEPPAGPDSYRDSDLLITSQLLYHPDSYRDKEAYLYISKSFNEISGYNLMLARYTLDLFFLICFSIAIA